jgi:F1F0 ATPase subunit 2
MMSVIGTLWLLVSFAAGGLLGLVVFVGLWLTVRGLDQARRPALRMLGSQALRLGLVLGVLYLIIIYGGWQHVLAALLGFTVLRVVVVRRIRRRPAQERLDT